MRHLLLIVCLIIGLSAGAAAVAEAVAAAVRAEADRPGAGTGTHVLDRGLIQWETGVDVSHFTGMHALTLPATLLRFGLSPWAEMRLEYSGTLMLDDKPNDGISPDALYATDPLWIGSKIRLWGGSEQPSLQWIPRTSLMLNIGLPLTKADANDRPLAGKIDLLFENDATDRLMISYGVGAYWEEWAPTPEVFASLGLNFAPTDRIGVFVESYNSFLPNAINPDAPGQRRTICDINLDFGITYMVHPRVQLDANAGFNLYHTASHLSSPRNYAFFGLGVAWLLYHPGK